MSSWTESHGQTMFGQYNLTVLEVDQAWLNITNFSNRNLSIYQLSKDCHGCPFIRNPEVSYLEPDETIKYIADTKFPLTYRLQKSGDDDIVQVDDIRNLRCEVETKMGEFGVYEIAIKENNCELTTVLEPVNIFLPFLIPIFIYLGIGVIVFLVKRYYLRVAKFIGVGMFLKQEQSITTLTGNVSSSKLDKLSGAPSKPRLRSLDTFRGICIVIMMFVHDGSAGYYFLNHATWDGLYVADLVFPWFLWIMGVCIPASIRSQVKRSIPKPIIFKRILVRSLKLVAIGIILNSKGGPIEWDKLRLPGVLQRFGLCYLVSATTVLLCANKDFLDNRKSERKYIAMFQDIFYIWKGWLIVLLLLILHSCLTFLLPVPGCPTAYLGPGGLHNGNSYPGECIGGAAGYIDRKILTLGHIYQWPTAINTYRSTPYDPEGLLGTLTSIFTVWLGVQTGLTLQVYPNHKSRVVRWSVWVVITGAIAAALCGVKETGGLIPINKNLWSLSFVFTLTSFALILLIFLYGVIDVWKIWSGTPFFEPGMNSLLLYIAHLVANNLLPFHFRLKRMNTHFILLMESLWGISLWVLYAINLVHKKFFWSL